MVMVKPGGTGRPALVISATPAPLPPSRSRIVALPSAEEIDPLVWGSLDGLLKGQLGRLCHESLAPCRG